MIIHINDEIVQVIILDVSSVYAQIHDQGYFNHSDANEIKQQYSNSKLWRVIVLDKEIN